MKLWSLSFLLVAAALPLSSSLFKPINAPLTTITLPGMRVNQVVLFQTLPYEAKPGAAVTLKGSGFSKTENKVHIGDLSVSATSTTGTTMNFIVPQDAPLGVHEVYVTNSFGTSKNPQAPVLLKVTHSPVPPPVITKIEEKKGVITLTGTGFASTNSIVTSLGAIEVFSSDQKTLSFALSSLPYYSKVKSLSKTTTTLNLAVFIKNEHGISLTPSMIQLSL